MTVSLVMKIDWAEEKVIHPFNPVLIHSLWGYPVCNSCVFSLEQHARSFSTRSHRMLHLLTSKTNACRSRRLFEKFIHSLISGLLLLAAHLSASLPDVFVFLYHLFDSVLTFFPLIPCAVWLFFVCFLNTSPFDFTQIMYFWKVFSFSLWASCFVKQMLLSSINIYLVLRSKSAFFHHYCTTCK